MQMNTGPVLFEFPEEDGSGYVDCRFVYKFRNIQKYVPLAHMTNNPNYVNIVCQAIRYAQDLYPYYNASEFHGIFISIFYFIYYPFSQILHVMPCGQQTSETSSPIDNSLRPMNIVMLSSQPGCLVSPFPLPPLFM